MAFWIQSVFVSCVPDPLEDSKNRPTLLLLAAGMGSRYGGLKQIDPMGPNGETLLDYAIYDAHRAGFQKAVFVIRQSMEDAFREQILSRYCGLMQMELAFQEITDLPSGQAPPPQRERPWGTGHAVLAARHTLKDGFAVINADDYYGPTAFALLANHLKQSDATTPSLFSVTYPLNKTLSEHGSVNRGICKVSSGHLTSVEEMFGIRKQGMHIVGNDQQGNSCKLNPEQPVSMNCWAMTPPVLQPLERAFTRFLQETPDLSSDEFFLPAFINALIATGGVSCPVKTSSDRWVGVTYPADKAFVQEQLFTAHQQGQYPDCLFS